MAITLPRENSLYYQEAVKEGLKKGMKEGKLEGKLEDAESMIKDGMALDRIQKYTGLSFEILNTLHTKI